MSLKLILLCMVTLPNSSQCNAISWEDIWAKVKKYVADHMGNSPVKTCEQGWMEYNAHCYFLSSESKTWHESEKMCRQLGSNLVKVDDAFENEWISTKLPTGGHILWLGGNDINKEGNWVWINDQSPVSYTNWKPISNEPNGKNVENCMNMVGIHSNNGLGTWNDMTCLTKLFFMCEKKLN